jgi:hypothetical protein
MSRVLGFGLFVVALLVSVELYVNGTSRLPGVASEQLMAPIERTERATGSFQRAWNSSEDRVERALDDPS